MKKTRILTLILVLIFASNLSFSQRNGKMPPAQKRQHGIENRIPNLSDQQKEQIKSLRLSFMSDVLPLKNQLKEKQAHLNTLQTAEKADLNQINKTIEEIGNLKINIAKRKALFRQNVRKNLDDEQRIYFDTHFSKREKMMHNKMKGNCKQMD